jgi:DNA-binding beta-propeller fold protein YncE
MAYGTGDYTYELVDGWAKLPEGWSFRDVTGVSIDKEDRVYVLNRGEHPVIVFDRDGNLLKTWGEGLFENAHGAAIAPDGSIYCTDDRAHVIYKFNQQGKLLQTIGKKGQASDTGYIPDYHDIFWSLTNIARSGPPFNRPTGVAIAPSGELYISDGYGNARVHKFTADGKLLFSWGEPGYQPGHFRLVHYIALDNRGRVWIADRENSRLQIFDGDGNFLEQWEDFLRPTDMKIKNDVVYVSELCQRVSILSIEGKVLSRFGNSGGKDQKTALFLAPHTIAVDSRGDIYVGEVSWSWTKGNIDKGSRVVQKFARKK